MPTSLIVLFAAVFLMLAGVGLVIVGGSSHADDAAVASGAPGARPEIDAREAHRAQAAGELTLIDVRTQAEWTQTGLPAGAVGVTLQDPAFVARVRALVADDTDARLALICRTGRRSQAAVDALAAAGFTNLVNVGDGMAGRQPVGSGWLAAGLPVDPVAAP